MNPLPQALICNKSLFQLPLHWDQAYLLAFVLIFLFAAVHLFLPGLPWFPFVFPWTFSLAPSSSSSYPISSPTSSLPHYLHCHCISIPIGSLLVVGWATCLMLLHALHHPLLCCMVLSLHQYLYAYQQTNFSSLLMHNDRATNLHLTFFSFFFLKKETCGGQDYACPFLKPTLPSFLLSSFPLRNTQITRGFESFSSLILLSQTRAKFTVSHNHFFFTTTSFL